MSVLQKLLDDDTKRTLLTKAQRRAVKEAIRVLEREHLREQAREKWALVKGDLYWDKDGNMHKHDVYVRRSVKEV